MEMRSRWVSFVPPPKVRMTVPRYADSILDRRIAPGDPDRTGNENEHARSIVARDEKRLARRVVSDLAEAAQALNLIGAEFRKHLLVARING